MNFRFIGRVRVKYSRKKKTKRAAAADYNKPARSSESAGRSGRPPIRSVAFIAPDSNSARRFFFFCFSFIHFVLLIVFLFTADVREIRVYSIIVDVDWIFFL